VTKTIQAYSELLPLAIALTLLAGYRLFSMIRAGRRTAYLLLAWPLVPVVVPFLVSHLYGPMLVDRSTTIAYKGVSTLSPTHYNNELAIIPYQGDSTHLFLFESPRTG
jgi:hypothetical protein